MTKPRKPTVEEVLKKYSGKIESKIKSDSGENFSSSYTKFKGEISSEHSKYEKWAHSLGNFIKIKPSAKDELKIKKHLDAAHLDVLPWQALGLAVMGFISIFFIGIFISIAVILIKGTFVAFPVLFFMLMVILSVFLFYFLSAYPERLANKWRLKASSQMVPAILYVVVYMRHTPNLEKAIAFAAKHLEGPLASDLKKVFYNVEIGKFSTIKESLDNYLDDWRGYSNEFIEAFHLIESSLFEPDNARRISILEKSIQVVLDGVYEKMLKFSHGVRAPLTNVYMLGVVLPTLGLALLPLASAMIGDMLNYTHVFIFFNLIIPFLVFYLTDKVLMLRPGGYGESNFMEKNPLYKKYRSNKPYTKAFLICLPFFILALLPLIFQFSGIPEAIGLQTDYSFKQLGVGFFGDEMFFGFNVGSGGVSGPFGMGSLFLSLLFPIGLGLFFSIAYKEKTKDLIKERKKTKELEKEFNNSLFQLGNRLGNGVPPELVFAQVAESNKGLKTGDFFSKVNYNIRQMGMDVEKAIFNKNQGALKQYPSPLIATSMRVLIESAKKGLKIAAVSLMSISEYIKNIGKINERLKDLLAEVSSDMKSNMTFLAPLLSGIVVGLAAMITSILGKLQLSSLTGGDVSGLGSLENMLNIFDVTSMIPPYFLQISVGIYLVQIIFILTSTLVSVESGPDSLETMNRTGLNLKKGIGLYFVTAFFAILALTILSVVVLGGLVG
jgi:hypothetical protein